MYGIFKNAITNGALSTEFIKKYFYCLWWGLQNLSSYGQTLTTSTFVGETLFAILIAILGLVLFAHLIGNMQFFNTPPYACEPSSLPKYPPSKEMDAKLRDEEARRLRAGVGKANVSGTKKMRTRERTTRAIPSLEANAELQVNIDRLRLITHANAKSKSEKFPPPHQDGALGYPSESSHPMDPAFEPPESSFSTVFPYQKSEVAMWSGPLIEPAAIGGPRRKKKSAATQMPANFKHLSSANATKES